MLVLVRFNFFGAHRSSSCSQTFKIRIYHERRFQFLIVIFEPNEELVRLCRVKLWHHYFLTFNRHTPYTHFRCVGLTGILLQRVGGNDDISVSLLCAYFGFVYTSTC